MNQIILCEKCQGKGQDEGYCKKCTFYLEEYCAKCYQSSEEFCKKCKEARVFLENDDKRQSSRERTDRNHIVYLDIHYVEDKDMLFIKSKNVLDQLLMIEDNKELFQSLECLTEIQRKRFDLYHVDGLTLQQIGKEEGVEYQTIQKSIQKSRKKIIKFLNRGV